MSTSDPTALPISLGTPDEIVPGTSALSAEISDVAVIAKLANEFFHALPVSGLASPPNAVSGMPVTAPSVSPELSLPSHPQFPTLPASVSPQDIAPITTPLQPTAPPVPGAAANLADANGPSPLSGSFLDEVRPIFGDFGELKSATAFDVPYAGGLPASPNRTLASPGIDVRDQRPSSPGTSAQPDLPSGSKTPAYYANTAAAPDTSYAFLSERRPPVSGTLPADEGVRLSGLDGELSQSRSHELPFQSDYAGEDVFSSECARIARDATLGFFEDQRPLYGLDPQSESQPLGIERDVPGELSLSSYPFDAESLKQDFPILRETVNGRPLVWLDNAATTQKPQAVIDRLAYFYSHENSNVHRAAHELAARATDAYEGAREKVRRFLNAPSANEIIFVRGATEGINLIAQSWGRRFVEKDDEIIITWLEHHANIVPWQLLSEATGAKIRVAPVDSTGQILLDEYERLFNSRTRLVSMTQVSNALGVVTPAKAMIEIAHRYGAKVLLDGAQSVSHMRVDVQALDCDFFVFSGHKVFGPTGIGVVYGKADVLKSMPPWQGGGNMIVDVTHEKTLFHEPPQRFEAGTGNIADAVGLGAAIDYLDRVGMENISRHEHELLLYATAELSLIPGLSIIGTAREKAGVISFVLEGHKTEEIGGYLNTYGIAVRSGHHCAQPILRRFGLEATVRASFALYNTREDIDRLVEAVWDLQSGRRSIQ